MNEKEYLKEYNDFLDAEQCLTNSMGTTCGYCKKWLEGSEIKYTLIGHLDVTMDTFCSLDCATMLLWRVKQETKYD